MAAVAPPRSILGEYLRERAASSSELSPANSYFIEGDSATFEGSLIQGDSGFLRQRGIQICFTKG